jgi:transposase
MEVVHERCCGLDVHKRTVVACLRTMRTQQTRTFGTATQDLLALADWLISERVTHVAMESTSVFWQPIYNVLEGTELKVLVVNAAHMKAIPGKKTDVKDAEWIADLLRHGLLRASFIPDRPQRELRELVRYRTSLIRQRAQVVHRIQKLLEGANIKLSSVVADISGASGRAMLEAVIDGQEDPAQLAGLARGRLRSKHSQLTAALRGSVGPHQRYVLRSQLRHLDFMDAEISELNTEITRRLAPFQTVLDRLDAIPGIGRRTAEAVLAEIGPDVDRFPTAGHLASWARVCPGNNESAGKRRSGSTGAGNPWLRTVLIEAGLSASHTRGSYLAAHYRRLAARRGTQRAIVAVAHTLLVIIYHLLQDPNAVYQDLGDNYFDERNRTVAVRRAVQRIERLGYRVTVEAA